MFGLFAQCPLRDYDIFAWSLLLLAAIVTVGLFWWMGKDK
jgi:hypothetical protein